MAHSHDSHDCPDPARCDYLSQVLRDVNTLFAERKVTLREGVAILEALHETALDYILAVDGAPESELARM